MQFPLMFALATFALLSNSNGLYGQSKKTTDLFPTYQQIKPATSEIIDYAPKQGHLEYTTRQVTFNLFDYPANTVTYVLNGKSTTDATSAKEVIIRKEIQIDNITIHPPTADGKRIIEIEYSTHQ